MDPVNALVLLNPTPKAVGRLGTRLRQAIYARLSELVWNKRAEFAEALSDHVCVSTLDAADLSIAFATVKDLLVVFDVAKRATLRAQQLETDFAALADVDFAQFGLRIEAESQGGDIPARLDRAVNLYCRRDPSAPNHRSTDVIFSGDDHEHAIAEVIHRLSDTRTRTWPSSEARQKFKDVLDNAEHDLQIIERGNQRFLVVEESRLPTLVARKNAGEMYRHFFEESEPMEPFERVPGSPLGRVLDLN